MSNGCAANYDPYAPRERGRLQNTQKEKEKHLRTEKAKSHLETIDKPTPKTTMDRRDEYRHRNVSSTPATKLEDALRITVSGKSLHLQTLSKRKQRMIRFNLTNPDSLREQLSH
jgi:hypothetical protein